jgi:hypothetical protein
MARTADHDATSPTARSGQRRPAHQQERAPEPEAAVVLTPEGHRRLAARAAWLATERIPRLGTTWTARIGTAGPVGSTGGP